MAGKLLLWVIKTIVPVIAIGYAVSNINCHVSTKHEIALLIAAKSVIVMTLSLVSLYLLKVLNIDDVTELKYKVFSMTRKLQPFKRRG